MCSPAAIALALSAVLAAVPLRSSAPPDAGRSARPSRGPASSSAGLPSRAAWGAGALRAVSVPGMPLIICHVPPGSPDNAHAIVVSDHALEAHLAHGDAIGECPVTSCDSNADCDPDFYCEKALLDCEGRGDCSLKPLACPGVFDPVCGCDGIDYSNACAAAASGVSVEADGPC